MYCKVKNLDIYYEIAGEGKPIIIIHGYNVDHSLMSGCMEPIFKNSDGYKRIYMDLPGMGKTKSAEWITNTDAMLDVVIEFIKKIIPNKSFLLVGESYGGYIARGIIHKMEDRVEGLFLLCTSVIGEHKKKPNTPNHVVLKKDEQLLTELSLEEAEVFKGIQVVQTRDIWNRYELEILSGLKLADKDFLRNIQKNGYEFSFEEDMMLNQKFAKPTLILLGRQDSVVGYKNEWNYLDSYPRATFAVLDKAGHNLQIEQGLIFDSLVNEWLERTKES